MDRVSSLLGLDPHTREAQTLEVNPPLLVPHGYYVGLMNVAGGSLNLRRELRELLWGNKETGYWSSAAIDYRSFAADDSATIAFMKSLSQGVSLKRQFRFRT